MDADHDPDDPLPFRTRLIAYFCNVLPVVVVHAVYNGSVRTVGCKSVPDVVESVEEIPVNRYNRPYQRLSEISISASSESSSLSQ